MKTVRMHIFWHKMKEKYTKSVKKTHISIDHKKYPRNQHKK